MAADDSQGGIPWLADRLLTRPEPTDAGGESNSSSYDGEHDSSRKDFVDTNQATGSGTLLLQDDEVLTDSSHSLHNKPSVVNSRQTYEGRSSSASLSLSPNHTPCLWRHGADKQPTYDEALLCEAAEASYTFTSVHGKLVRDSEISETEPEAQAFDNPIGDAPLPKLKERFLSYDDDLAQFVKPSLMRNLLAGNELHEAIPMEITSPQSLEESCSQDIRNLHPGLDARSLLQNPTTPQHNHRKRVKYLPLLSRQHPLSASAGRSSADFSSSSSCQSLQFEGFPGESSSVGFHSNSSSQLLGRSEGNMDIGNDADVDENSNVEMVKGNGSRFDLTDDLLLKVFSFQDHITLCHAALVCRQWRAASVHEDFWKSLNFEYRQVTNAQVAEVCARYPRATELHLKNTANVEDWLILDAMRSLRNLEVLTLGGNLLDETFFSTISNSASLRTLSITDASLGSGGVQEVQLRHEGLRSLQIIKCRVLRLAIRCPQLEELSLNRTGTASAVLHCPRLTSLNVTSCHKLSDAGVRAAAIACTLLTSLNISSCIYVTDDTLREISLACTNLEILDASNCSSISLEGVRMPMLTELKLQNCEGINSSSMAALSHCIMLEVLAMDCCWLLTSVNLDLPHLRSISLANNKKLVELTLRSPFLVSLDLTNCPALHHIDLASSSLLRLDLKNQSSLASLALRCPWLRVVDLSDCESLTDLVCNVFSEGGGCPKLKTLILDNCDGLVKVKLCTASLEKLSLVGCRKVSTLELSCLGLQYLQLDGCDRLIDAYFVPVGLLSLNLGICPHLTNLVIKADHMIALDLRGCGLLSQAIITCPSLSSLDASYCSKLGDECLATTTSACPAIQQLVLAACFLVGPVGLLALKKLVDLTVLDLSYTFLTDLSPIFEACPRLKVLRLSACKYLEENALDALHSGKKLPELQELDISYGSLGRRAIEAVLAECPHLVHISLNGCASVTDHLWAHLCSRQEPLEPTDAMDIFPTSTDMVDSVAEQGSARGANSAMDVVVGNQSSVEFSTSERALQSLSCVGCQNVRSVTLVAETCPHLSTISLSLSTNIREVNLACINLVSLNLSNCASLSVLNLECPRLMTLSLHACGIEFQMLEVALQGCPMLESLDLRNCTKITAADLASIRGRALSIKRLYSTVPPEYRLPSC